MKPKSDRVDMESIAQRLGVSKTTIHYAIRNTGRLSDATRKRILKAVTAMGYRPNGLARSFRRRRVETVGVVVTTLTNSTMAHLLEGIEVVTRQNRHTMLVASSHGKADVERQLVEVFLEQGVAGMIVVPCDPMQNRDYYQRLIDEQTCLVFVDREIPGLTVEMVSTDHEKGAYAEAAHLLKLGRKQLVCVATRSPEHRSTSVQQRLQGVNRALKEAGLGPAVVLGTDPPDFSVHEQYGYQVMREHLKNSAGRFDAVCAVHDDLAYGVIRALIEAGLRVPNDVAVVGFDDQDPSAYFQPALTTVRQPMHEIGMEAGRLLFLRMQEGNIPMPCQRIMMEPKLIVRESCGTPTGDRKISQKSPSGSARF